MRPRTLLLTAALVGGVGLAACHKETPQVAALPLDMGAAQPMGEAPAPGALPPAPPAQIAAPASYGDAYAYPDRAWGMSWAFGDSPPDYAFDDDGVTPWVWIADDDSEALVEPVPGGERYYYFEPGAYTPFYVQDPTHGYGFKNGALVAIYDRSGREIAPSANPAAAATAGQYLARGRQLRQEAGSHPHQPVAAANWSARRGLIAAQGAALARNAQTNPAWRAYHDQHASQIEAHFAGEAARRETWAAQTDARLGAPTRARSEQRLAQSISQGGAAPAGRASPPGPSLAAVVPAPQRGRGARAQLARSAAPSERAVHAVRAAQRAFARAGRERSTASARTAAEHASDAGFRALATHAPATHAATPPPHVAGPPHVASPAHGPAAPRAPPAAAANGGGEGRKSGH